MGNEFTPWQQIIYIYICVCVNLILFIYCIYLFSEGCLVSNMAEFFVDMSKIEYLLLLLYIILLENIYII